MIRSGMITADEIWQGEVTVNGDIVVPSGIVLTIMPGCNITFTDTKDYIDEDLEMKYGFVNGSVFGRPESGSGEREFAGWRGGG